MRELADSARIRRFMRALGEQAEAECRVYFTGGATAVLKESLRINVEIASPAHFIPELPGWQERSRFIERQGKASFYHYDFYAQALAKIERGEQKDLGDVREMVARGLIERTAAWDLFRTIETKLYRFPAIDPARFRRAVLDALGPSST